MGERPRTEVLERLRSARLLICTSRYEADPMAVKEAMASGTPVLVTKAAAAALRSSNEGWIEEEPLDTKPGRESFANKAVRILENPQLWETLSRGSLSAAARFSPETERSAYADLYSDLLETQIHSKE
jgi:glycosyltransferase involved in cell wall biosynthesis